MHMDLQKRRVPILIFAFLLLGQVCSWAQSRNLTVVVLVNSQNTTGYNPSSITPGEFQRFAERYLDAFTSSLRILRCFDDSASGGLKLTPTDHLGPLPFTVAGYLERSHRNCRRTPAPGLSILIPMPPSATNLISKPFSGLPGRPPELPPPKFLFPRR